MVEEHEAFQNIPSMFIYMACSFSKKSMLNALKMCVGKSHAFTSLRKILCGRNCKHSLVLLELFKDSKHLAVLIRYVQDQLFLLLLETKF